MKHDETETPVTSSASVLLVLAAAATSTIHMSDGAELGAGAMSLYSNKREKNFTAVILRSENTVLKPRYIYEFAGEKRRDERLNKGHKEIWTWYL